ncbi:FAD-binding oxidoreductase [Methylobacterium terricola]|uniref:FAD-binding oxidoreductase n=1 Tax=Methylobacterium terricola TaxID=2583531 RepID=A0A5C4L804_9HYPH|nr:FAD-binding oxidoreductase [Methylobacterium terricola]TNC08216.1 FAD-binding oxidoreductase [Methylobacterium terricola]
MTDYPTIKTFAETSSRAAGKTSTAVSRRRLFQSGAVIAGAALGSRIPGAAALEGPPPRGLDALARDLRGRLIRPGEPGFLVAAWPNNGRWADVLPLAIAMCTGGDDVRACINWARQERQTFAVRCGGHNYAGFSTTHGLLIDVKPMSGIQFDPKTGFVTIGAGASNQDMADAFRATGLAVPSGRCPTVGISGLTLGGGWGFSATRNGLTCDALRATDAVTADGTLHRGIAATGDDASLFWAARGGGGGNFAVHTSFTFEPHPVYDVTVFNIVWPARHQIELMLDLQDIQLNNPHLISTRSKLVPIVAGQVQRDKLGVQTLGQFFGPPDQLRALLDRPLSRSKPTVAEINRMNYWSARDYLVTDDPGGFYDIRSSYVAGQLGGDAIDTMMRCMEKSPCGSVLQQNMGILFAAGGRVKAVRPTDTAYVHRESDFILEMETSWSPLDMPDMVKRQQAWLTEYFAAMQRFVKPQSYVNFPSRDLPNWLDAYYGENVGRLCEVKRRYDPDDVFKFPQSVPLKKPA